MANFGHKRDPRARTTRYARITYTDPTLFGDGFLPEVIIPTSQLTDDAEMEKLLTVGIRLETRNELGDVTAVRYIAPKNIEAVEFYSKQKEKESEDEAS